MSDQASAKSPGRGTCLACGHQRFAGAGNRKVGEAADDTMIVPEMRRELHMY